MARIQLERLPQNDDELYELVKVLWGVVIPRERVCPDHVAPFEVFADAYFRRGSSISLWHGSRGLSGKSFMLSVLGLTVAVLIGSDVNLLGGSLAQSTNIHEHMRNALDSVNSPRYMVQTEANTQIKFSNRARIRPLTASQKTVRGPHPATLLLDEIDEMDEDILNAALGQPMPQINYLKQEIKPYTVMCVTGDTKILTPVGEVPIEDMLPGNEVMTRKGWRRVKRVIYNGERSVVQIKLSNGRVLNCTDDHRILINGEWTTARDMLASIDPTKFTTSFISSFSTGNAFSSTMCRDKSVSSAIGMSTRTMSFSSVNSAGSTTALLVNNRSDRLKMSRIATSSLFAQMIQFSSSWYGTNDIDVCPPVDNSSIIKPVHVSIPTTFSAIPHPTSFRCDSTSGDEPVFVVGISASGDHAVPVYDLEVEDVHEFVAESIVIHNCSTWQNSDGTFEHKYREFQEKGLPIKTWCYRESANPIDGWLSQETIDQKKLEIPAEMWRVEYELGEPSIGNRAFDTDAVEEMFSLPVDAIRKDEKQRFEEYTFEEPVGDGIYVASADWAKEQDYTVISVIRLDRQPHTLVYYLRVNRRPYPMMIKWFNDAIDRYNAEAIHDATGLGNVVNDYIDVRARKFIMTGEKRSNMLTEFVGAVERGYFKFPRIPSAYTAHKYCRTGDLYSGSLKDFHLPDEVCSFALAWNVGKRFSGYGDPVVVKRDGTPGKYEKHFIMPGVAAENSGIISPSYVEGVVVNKTQGDDDMSFSLTV